MHDRELSALLTKLNTGRGSQTIVRVPLHPDVDYAKVWTTTVSPKSTRTYLNQPYTFYFVKNGSGLYSSCVHDAGSDLHWYTARKHRGQGLLRTALSTVIIPHLLGKREEITITIQARDELSRQSSERLAGSLGFRALNDAQWEYAPEYRPVALITPQSQLTPQELERLQNRMHFAKDFIRISAETLRLHYGDVKRVEELTELAYDVASVANNLVDSIKYGYIHELDQ